MGLFKNTLSSILFQIVSIICGFILPNYYLRIYGAIEYGLVVSVTQYLQLISLCELGVGAVVQAALYKPIADKNKLKINQIFAASQSFYKKIAYILCVYVVVLVIIYPYVTETKVDIYFSSFIILAIAFKLFLQFFFGISYRTILTAAQYISIIMNIGILTLLVNLVLSIVLMEYGCSLITVIWASSLIFIIQPLLLAYYARKHFELEKVKHIEHNVIPQKWNGIAQHIATISLENVPVIILTAFTSLATVSIYAVYHMVTNGLKLAFISLLSSISPFMGNLSAKNELKNLSNFFEKIVYLTLILDAYIFTIAYIALLPFIHIYTDKLDNPSIYIIPSLAIWMCVSMAIYVLRLPFSYLIQSCGHFKQTQNSAFIEAGLNIVFSIVLVKIWGVVGVAIAISIALFYRLLYFLYYVRRLIDFKSIVFIKSLSIILIASLLLIYISSFISPSCNGYIEWLFYSIKISLAGLVVYSIILMALNRNQTLTLLKSLIHKKSVID